MSWPESIALIAQANQRDKLIRTCAPFVHELRKTSVIATAGTAKIITDELGVQCESVPSGIDGGVLEIASRVLRKEIGGVIFLVDPRVRLAHGSDARSLIRLCILENVPIAFNEASAQLYLSLSALDDERSSADSLRRSA